MNIFKKTGALLGSKGLTVWLAGLFIVYYVSIAVWSREAFAHLIENLGHNVLFQVLGLLLVLNVTIRIVFRLRELWQEKSVFFMRLPLYGGILLVLAAFFLSVNVRKNTWVLVGEGDIMNTPWDPAPLKVVSIHSALEKSAIRTENSLIFSSEPAVVLLDQHNFLHTVGAFPPRLVGSNFMHVLNFGIGPGVELKDRDSILNRGEVALRLTPFGSVDKFELPPSPYQFYVSILPNRTVKKGRETAQEYDLDKPKYRVEIVKADKTIARGETDEEISFDRTMSLRFRRPSNWVLLDVAYDPFLPFFVSGLALTAAGIILFPVSFIFRKLYGPGSF